MPRTATDVRQDLELMEQVEQLLFDLKTSTVPLDASFLSLEALRERGTAADNIARFQERERRWRLRFRIRAVQPQRQQLHRLIDRADRLLHRHPLDGHSEWWCEIDANSPRTGTALRELCSCACASCCDAAQLEVIELRQRLTDELRTPFAARPQLSDADRRAIYNDDGSLNARAQRILRALPSKNYDDLAARSGLTKDVVKKIMVLMQRAGEVHKDGKKGYLRGRGDVGT